MYEQQIKQAAKEGLKGFWTRAIVAVAAMQAVSAIITLSAEMVLYFSGLLYDPMWGNVIVLAGSLLAGFFAAPLKLGFERMMFVRALGGTPSLYMLFELFGTPRRLFSYFGLVIVRGVLVALPAVLLGAPLVALSLLQQNGYTFTGMLAGQTGNTIMLLSLLLALTGLLLSAIMAMRYLISDYVFIAEPKLNFIKVLRVSSRVTQGYKGMLFSLLISFLPWALLCLTGFAILYVQPYYTASVAVTAGLLMERYEMTRRPQKGMSNTAVYECPQAEGGAL